MDKMAIKFQAFNTHDREMYGNEVAALVLYKTSIDPDYEKGKWILRQFTGLQDKNGRDIYNGDIAKCFKKDEWENILEDFVDATMEWKQKAAAFRFQMPKGEYFHIRPEQIEVIGNIYENPEPIAAPNDERSVATVAESEQTKAD